MNTIGHCSQCAACIVSYAVQKTLEDQKGGLFSSFSTPPPPAPPHPYTQEFELAGGFRLRGRVGGKQMKMDAVPMLKE